jgi:ribonuclease BN (tRNA processing enzyme)
VRLALLGVRGSTPAPGPEFVRYGGHTSCIAVFADGADVPTLMLDAGTGLRALTRMLGGAAFAGSILVSHLHWDHVQGLPFCQATDRPDSRVAMLLPGQDGRSGRDLLALHLSPPAFPITPEGLQGDWRFDAIEPGLHEVEGFEVVAAELEHKGGRTFGYRVSDASSSIAYLPDHRISAGVGPAVRALVAGVDLLIHDAQFLEPERALADAYGHSTVQDAVTLAREEGAHALLLFHHGPDRTDDALDSWSFDDTGSLRVSVAAQGVQISLP